MRHEPSIDMEVAREEDAAASQQKPSTAFLVARIPLLVVVGSHI
jgi:hypothetical protein